MNGKRNLNKRFADTNESGYVQTGPSSRRFTSHLQHSRSSCIRYPIQHGLSCCEYYIIFFFFSFTQIDVFSYGLLVCEMCNGELPLPDQAERKKQIEKITDATVRGLVEACTREDPQKRPAMEDLIDFWKRI